MNPVEVLWRAIRRRHEVKSVHVRSEHVTERVGDRTVWYGVVEVFASIDDPSVVAYGWVANAEAGEPRYVTVLGTPPVRSARDAVRAHLAAAASVTGEPPGSEVATPDRRALIIENYAPVLEALPLLVHGLGYEVEAVASGAEGLARFSARVPDVVIVEVRVRDGCDVIRRMKAAAPGVFVIANTSDYTMRTAAQQAGANVFILKPDIETLEGVLLESRAASARTRGSEEG